MAFLSLLAAFLASHTLVQASPARERAQPIIDTQSLAARVFDPINITNLHQLDLADIAASLGDLPVAVPSFNGSLESRSLQEKRDIYGPDNRYQYTNTRDFPYRTVGRILIYPAGGGADVGSGALVGERLVLTARHVALPFQQGAKMSFSPQYDGAPQLGTYNVINAYVPPLSGNDICQRAEDWGLLALDTRIGDYLGYMGVGLPNSQYFDKPVLTSVGYPGDRDSAQRPYRQDGISILSRWVNAERCDANGPIVSSSHYATGSWLTTITVHR